MRKPISKHALRRALEQVHSDGFLQWEEPVGTVVDKIWHEIGKRSYNGSRKKAVSRETVRVAATELPELGADPLSGGIAEN